MTRTHRAPIRCALYLTTVVAALAFAQSAFAVTNFTSSQITTPTDNTFVQQNFDTGNLFHVEGTTAGGDSNADLYCYWGTSRTKVATNITVTSGAFSVDVPFDNLTASYPRPYCVLRAIPTGDATDYPPNASSSFQGPRIGAGSFQTYMVNDGGPNNDVVNDFFLSQAQSQGYMDYLSAGGCALDYSFLFDPVTFGHSKALFYCNGWFWRTNGASVASSTEEQSTRSELQVDGNNAYLPANAGRVFYIDSTHNSGRNEGYPALTFNTSIDPANGNPNITETDPIVRCNPNGAAFHPNTTDPAWPADCSSFTPVGVKLDRTIKGDRDGRRSTITDMWSSTDGASHQLDMQYDEEFSGDSGTNPSPTFQYPWLGSDYVPASVGNTAPGPSADGPTTVLVDGNGASDDVFGFPQGSVTFSTAPNDIHWYYVSSSRAYSVFHFVRTIPAGGSLKIVHVYSDGSSKDDVTAEAAAERNAIGSPTIAITSPANGSTVNTANVTASGTSSDPGGAVTGVTVNGQAATLNSDGSWSKALTLNQGQNTITAVASDADGNTGSATSQVTFSPPPPPVVVVDKVAPILKLIVAHVKLAKLIAKGLPVTVGCSEPCGFAVGLTIDSKTAKRVGLAARTVRIGRATGRLTAAGTKKLTVKLTKKAKRKLAHVRKVTIKVTLTGKDAAGNTARKSKVVTIKR